MLDMSPGVVLPKFKKWIKDIAPKDALTPTTETPRHTRQVSIKETIKRNSLLVFRRPSKHTPVPKPAKISTDVLPSELWHRILRYALRLTGAQAVDPKDPFELDELQEDYPNIHPGYFEDRRACRATCRLFNSLVTEIMMEYIVVHSQGELEWTVKVLEDDHLTAEHKRLGDWTTRIDFCISGSYDPGWMLRLFALTPNLLIFTTDTGRSDHPEHPMNQTVLHGLIDFHSSNLKRLEWVGLNDAPTYEDLYLIAKNIRCLTTLHLRHLYSLPLINTIPNMMVFPSLKYLSLGLIPLNRPPDVSEEQFPFRWDIFLMYLVGRSLQLPKIEHFSVDICPIPDFFSMYGHKLRTFSTTSWSSQECIDGAFELLPNLDTFLYIYHTAPECYIPLYQPTLKRIAVTPRIENYVEVPLATYQCCIIKPLDNFLANVEDMDAKKLTDVRICDRGAFTGVFESDACLFWHWRKRLQQYKQIILQNRSGDLDAKYAKYGDTPPHEPNYKIVVERPIPKTAKPRTDDTATVQPSASTSTTTSAPTSTATSTAAPTAPASTHPQAQS